MISFWPRMLIILCGCLIGYALATNGTIGNDVAVQLQQNSPVNLATPQLEPQAEATTNTLKCVPAPSSNLDDQRDTRTPPVPVAELPDTGLPEKFHEMVEPESDEPKSFAEWYQAYLIEARDEAWAAPVETQIKQAIDVSGVQGIQGEYVSCRLTRCVVAGYVDSGIGFDSCKIGGWIGRARVFRQTFGFTCRDEEIGGLQRYVVLIDSERSL